jgi:hypothetical protein
MLPARLSHVGRTIEMCTYDDCEQESGREWNLQRHIMRIHGGEGKPVKNKSSADTSKIHGMHIILPISSRIHMYPIQMAQCHNHSATKGLHPRSQSGKEENNKNGREEKTSGQLDFVEIAYPIFRRSRDNNDKIEEMRNYFANHNQIPFPPRDPLDILDYGINGMPPYHVGSEFHSTPMPSSLGAPQVCKNLIP